MCSNGYLSFLTLRVTGNEIIMASHDYTVETNVLLVAKIEFDDVFNRRMMQVTFK